MYAAKRSIDFMKSIANRARTFNRRIGRNRGMNARTFTKCAPRKDHRGVDLISDALPFGRLWYAGPNASDFVIKKLPPHTQTV